MLEPASCLHCGSPVNRGRRAALEKDVDNHLEVIRRASTMAPGDRNEGNMLAFGAMASMIARAVGLAGLAIVEAINSRTNIPSEVKVGGSE